MAKKIARNVTSDSGPGTAGRSSKKQYLSQTDVPRHTLKDALRIPQSLADHFGKQATKPLSVADAIEMSPTSSTFRMLTGASIAYGLTDGGYNAAQITLTELGRRIVSPLEEGEDWEAQREAFLKPRVISEFLTKYNNSKLPPARIAGNVLEDLGVPNGSGEEIFNFICEGASELQLLREIKGSRYVDLERKPSGPTLSQASDDVESDDIEPSDSVAEADAVRTDSLPRAQNPSKPADLGKAIFLAHGRDLESLESLKSILSQFKVPFEVAVETPNLGRPISTKVRETMQKCNCAILLFTADEEFKDDSGSSVWRPSQNVIHELGACSYLYENRIVILKDSRIQLPTNFSDIGYIPFTAGNLGAQSMEIIKELIGFEILRIST